MSWIVTKYANLRWVIALAVLTVLPRHADASSEFTPCKNDFTPQQQIELGDKAKQQVYKQMPVLPDSSPVTQYVQRLGQRLASNAPGYKWPYNFHVANVAEVNAFALPGGSIFVNLGTIQAATTEAQLAGVMAHEISHVVLQHSVCNAEKQQRVGLLAGIGQIAAGVLLGGTAGEIAQQGIGLTAGLGFLKMSRSAEREADLEGAGLAYDSGYDPHGMTQFFQIIESKYGQGGAQFLSDHPNPGNRTEYVDKEIAKFPPRANLAESSPEFDRLRSQVAGMHAYTAKEISSGAWRTRSPNQTVGAGVHEPAGLSAGSVKPDLNTSGSWRTLRGDGFSMQIPSNWQAYGNQKSFMIAPQGGIVRSADGGAGNVVYGVLSDHYQPRARNGSAISALISEIAAENPGFRPGRATQITVNGVSAQSIECDNPSANNGAGEHDWIVAFQQQDGTVRYFVFVAPRPDFDSLRPSFERMLQTLRIQT